MRSFINFIKAYLMVGFVCFHIVLSFAQDQSIADSLVKIYQEDNLQGISKLKLLEDLSFNERNNFNLSLKYAEELIVLSKRGENFIYLSKGYYHKGNSNRILGNLENALEAFFKSAEVAIKAKSIEDEGVANMSIADIYSEMGNSDNAEIYYAMAIELLRKTDASVTLATALLNAGDEAFNVEKYEKALLHFEESGLLFKNSNYLIGTAYNLGNVGMIHAQQGNHRLAEEKLNEAITMLEELSDYYAISEYLTYMSDIYLEQNDWKKAVTYAERSLELAKKNGLKKQIGETNLKLSELHQHAGNLAKSYDYYKDHIKYRDSVINLENIEKAADLRTNFEVSQKQVEVDLLNEQKRNQRIIVYATGIALFLIGLLAFGLYRRNKYVNRTNTIIAKEKERSDSLLLNILPEETANELKINGKVKAKKFKSVTVLFTDFKGFTEYAEKLTPEELVESVDFYFSKFDEIMEKYGLEKIKTVGDAYMCAGGLNSATNNHAHKMVMAALDIAEFVKTAKLEDSESKTRFDIRIGINTGPVVAGVVGTKKFAYDIWGDSVNIASRMESNSEPGRINISENTFELIMDAFDCEHRGNIEVKNRGLMKMYFVNGMKDGEVANNLRDTKAYIV